jgi:hypothetical protein
LEELLAHPAVQGGVLPFIVGLLVTLVLQPLRLGGLAAAAGFATAVYFVAGFTPTPLTAMRKIILLGLAAPVAGILIDFGFKPNRAGAAFLALLAGAATVWVFWPALAQKSGRDLWLSGATAAGAVAVLVGIGMTFLTAQPVRAGAAGLITALGVGVASMLAASAPYGLYAIALAAGSGAFLLVQMLLRGKPAVAGATFVLPAMLIAGLVASGAMLLGQLRWYAVAVLALVPVGALLPVPRSASVWLQAVLLALYASVIAAGACYLAWHA